MDCRTLDKRSGGTALNVHGLGRENSEKQSWEVF